jgi:hypothetical protein
MGSLLVWTESTGFFALLVSKDASNNNRSTAVSIGYQPTVLTQCNINNKDINL